MWQASVELNIAKNRNIAEEQAWRDLQAAGMSQGTIEGLRALSHKYIVEFAKVQKDQEACDKFHADFQVESENFLGAMSPKDREIYDAHRKRHGIDK